MKKKLNKKQVREKVVKKQSAGGVVFRKINKGLELLMILDLKNRWSLPKGSIENEEDALTAAKREVFEETGIGNLELIKELGETKYYFRHRGAITFLTLTLFLFIVKDTSQQIVVENSKSIVAVEWVPIEDALDRIEYEDLRNLIKNNLESVNL